MHHDIRVTPGQPEPGKVAIQTWRVLSRISGAMSTGLVNWMYMCCTLDVCPLTALPLCSTTSSCGSRAQWRRCCAARTIPALTRRITYWSAQYARARAVTIVAARSHAPTKTVATRVSIRGSRMLERRAFVVGLRVRARVCAPHCRRSSQGALSGRAVLMFLPAAVRD